MIDKIEFLKCFGIFQNYIASTSISEFKKYNLFYGWNGCGKSTLSKLFACLEHKKIDIDFPECEFKIQEGENFITHLNIAETSTNIKVFNQDFIKANIEWDKGVKSLLLIAEDKIEDRKQLDELKKEIFKITDKINHLVSDSEHLQKQVNLFYSSSAKTIKESFKVLDTSDKYYFNYDKTKFEKFIEENEKEVLSKESIFTEVDRDKLVKSIQPVTKEEINFSISKIQIETYKEARQRISNILERNVIAQTIDRLKENPEINSWVKEGLDLHKQLISVNCEFCNQTLPQLRFDDLNKHFNDAYEAALTNITKAIEWIESFDKIEMIYPEVISFYDEFQQPFLSNKNAIESTKQKILGFLDSWKSLLQKKYSNPFDKVLMEDDHFVSILEEYNINVETISQIINNHNKKTKNFASDLQTKKKKLELHFAADFIQNSEVKSWEKQMNENNEDLAKQKKLLTGKNIESQKIETTLIDEAKGAEHFNRYLHKFLGRTDISLRFNKEAKGYNIFRGKGLKPARNLSEGEKTAIAFVYFVIKLTEKGNDIEKTVVVVDDPISSFDSNHLFHSFSFLKSTCDKAMQLFVLTHNFQYFRLIRDWFEKKNDFKKGKIRTKLFTIESSLEEERSSSIKNAHETLQNYNSEYHYVFYKMHSIQNDEIDNLDKAYLIGNLCRKMLEGFLTFKFPRARSDFRRLMEDCCKDTELLERIYRFINKYSHNQLIEFHDTPVDNLISEGKEIVRDVFSLMKTLDENHVKEMEEICT
jgi:wobble nucleotide-excising tRNase